MSVASISGLASGIDWQSTVDQLMEIESRRKKMLEQRKSDYNSRMSAWQELNSKLLQFKTLSENMDLTDEFLTKNITSSDSDILTGTATAGAATGTFSIEINQLAKAEKLIHAGWSDVNTTAINSSGSTQQFVFTYGTEDGSETVTIDVADGATLGDLRDLINNNIDNDGVSATIINDGSGGNTAYHLVLTSKETGADYTITIDDSATTVGDGTTFDTANWTETQSAQNAQVRVDGYPPGDWIESASNDVKEVIDGVTLHLADVTETDTPVQITINNDIATAKSKINDFVDAYNDIITKINEYTSYDSASEEKGILFGDSGVNSLKRQLAEIATGTIPGLPATNTLKTLGEIGITNDENGLLQVDDGELSDALNDHFLEVGELFTFDYTTDSTYVSFFYRTEDTVGGEHEVVVNYDDSGAITSATINGHEASIENDQIIGADGYDEAGLRLKFTAPEGGAGTVTATVTLTMGKAASFTNKLSKLTDTEDGLVHTQTEGIQDTISNLDEQIADQVRRLEVTRQKYIKQFTAMEMQMSKLKQQGDYLAGQLAKI